jgi:chromosome segregation protein
MHLKRIELEGFKSFADRTVIPVEHGLTGIVGPNGCGKSNVVDALLWVMGERSAKALRADSMDDVIFKGAEGRSSAPYAMVEVVLGDPEGTVVEPGGEVAVGRRLFASGESEFLLHGRKVRRKDVREVLLDTGLGVQGYMVLAQGKIDAVLAANPDERRSVFEEAAGISRYKARKHETKLKLKGVERDLSKVDTVLDEVSRTVRSLRMQAGKAKRFIELRDGYRDLRIRFALADSTTWHSSAAELRDSLKNVVTEIDSLTDQRDRNESHFAELESELATLRERHQSLRNESSQVKEQVATLEERVAGLQTRAAEADTQVVKDNARLEVLVAEQTKDGQANSELLAEKNNLDQRIAMASTRLDEVEVEFNEARDLRNAGREEVERLRSEILDALQQRSVWNNKIADAAKQRSESAGGLGAVERRFSEIVEELTTSETAVLKTHADVTQQQHAFNEQQGKLRLAQQRTEELKDKHTGFDRVAHEAAQAKAAAEARVEAYGVVDDEMPGVPEHLPSYLDDDSNNVSSWVLEMVSVAAPWDAILENMLGRMQHAFWCDSVKDFQDLPKGVFDFFSPVVDFVEPVKIEGATSLFELLQGDMKVRQALCARLGSLYCVDSLSEAQRLVDIHPQAMFLVASGDLIANGYARRGVSSEDAAGVLARRNGKQAAETTLQKAIAAYDSAHTLERDCAQQLQQAQAEYEQWRDSFATVRDDLHEVLARDKQLTQRHSLLEEEHKALESQRKQLSDDSSSASTIEQDAVAKRDHFENLRLELIEELNEKDGALKSLDNEHESISAKCQEIRLDKSECEQDLRLWTARHSELAARAQRQEDERSTLQTELSSLSGRGSELRQQAEEARNTRTSLLERRSELSERCEQAETHVERATQALHHERTQASGESQRYDGLVADRHQSELELQKLELRSQELARGVQEEFGQSVDGMVNSLGIDRDSIFAEGTDLDEARKQVAESRQRIERIGSVNLDAVNELEERAERESFLISERDDLFAAKTNLEDTLEELDVQCRERFVETFDKVKVEFESIFRRLFSGGKASIGLEEGVDPLEAGIEISAKPPGKELRSINLLSGGERTLTALALLLAVFQSRPSPFCLLDEVDAALDDANVERFANVIQDFIGTTQFLVVTHNRISMARCQRLFGVTMRKKGVSMVVSVDLEEMQGDGEINLSSSKALGVDIQRPPLEIPAQPPVLETEA